MHRHRDDLGHFAQVLGGGCEEELVFGAIWSPKAQSVELEDSLEVGEQHLHLLSLAARGNISVGERNRPCLVPSCFMNRSQNLARWHVGRAALP